MPNAGPTLVALAALFWGLSGGIGGILLAAGWDPFVLAFYRGVIGLACVVPWLWFHREENGLANRRLWFWSVLAGIGVAGNFSFYFISIGESGVAVAATLMYCAPVYVFLASFALGCEPSTPLKWIAIVLVMLGIVLLTDLHDLDAGSITRLGIVSGLLSGLCYALFIFAFRFADDHGSPQATLLVAFGVLVTLVIWGAPFDQTVAVVTTPDWPLFLAMGLLGAGLSFFLFVVGMEHTKPTTAAMVALVEPVTASLFGVALMNESLDGLQFLGMGLVLVTVTTLSVHSNR